MASGRLGIADLVATTNTTVYTVPASKTTSFSISVCNRNAISIKIRIALASLDTPTASEWIEYETSLSAYGVLERSGIILDTGKKIVVYSDTANVSVIVYGMEE